jgi:5-methylcytosine-specific restriction enzyme A
MLKSCNYCGRVHETKYDCGKKPKRHRKISDGDRFRWSNKWKVKREQIREADLYLCQVCKTEGKYKYNDLEVHHVVPLEEDYDKRLDDDNLITLCSYHHERAESGEISRDYIKSLIKGRYDNNG